MEIDINNVKHLKSFEECLESWVIEYANAYIEAYTACMEERYAIAANMKSVGVPANIIMQTTGLTEDEMPQL